MRYEMIQTRKDLFDADFTLERKGEKIGEAAVRGWTLATTGAIQGSFMGTRFSLQRNYPLAKMLSPHDPRNEYTVTVNGQAAGALRHMEKKTGLFRRLYYDAMELDGRGFQRYGIGLGEAGNCSPIYSGEIQVGQFSIDTEIVDDCFHYRCAASDESSGFVVLLFCCYSYITACYRPGEIHKSSIRKTYSKTTDRDELKYYDPGFIETVAE